jgi:hypothetical protein
MDYLTLDMDNQWFLTLLIGKGCKGFTIITTITRKCLVKEGGKVSCTVVSLQTKTIWYFITLVSMLFYDTQLIKGTDSRKSWRNEGMGH